MATPGDTGSASERQATRPLKVAIIGTGGIANLHVKGYRASEGVELVACADIVGQRARDFAATHEIANAYEGYERLLDAHPDLDGVSVTTPNYAHSEPTIAALGAGVNVLCEKPIAMNAEEAAHMVEAASEAAPRALLTIGHHMRFLPFARFLKRMVEAGDLGKVYYARSHALRRRGVPGWGQFHIKSKSGGGPLIDIGVHALDLIIWLMGSPTPKSVSGSVYTEFGNRATFFNPHGTYRREEYDVEDFACAMVKFDNGASLTLEASWAAHVEEDESFPQLLLGEKAGARIIPTADKSGTPLKIFTSRDEALLDTTPQPFPPSEPHVEQIKHWCKVMRGEAEVVVRPQEALNTQRIIDAIYLSSQEGREIRINEVHALEGEGRGKVGSNLALTPVPQA